MGFWHTGYGEFHEPVGLALKFKPQPERFLCLQCDKSYASSDELIRHRFEDHPLRRPVMLIQGRELGTNGVRITQPISASDVHIDCCNRALLNDNEIPISLLPARLAKISSGVCRIILSKDNVRGAFELDFRIASKEDLEGVEAQLERVVRGRKLNTHVIEEFIELSRRFTTAIGYYDGICTYLYGVLAKERVEESTLPYAAYEGKFNKAAKALADYDRPLARTIRSLIGFHFNHFRDSARLSPESRVGRVSARYSDWIESPVSLGQDTITIGTDELERLVTDEETERVLRWTTRPLRDLAKKEARKIEYFLQHASAEYDRAKLRILLGKFYAQCGDVDHALKHTKALRNVTPFQGWAEALGEMLRKG